MNEDTTTIIAEVLELNGKFERMIDGLDVMKEKRAMIGDDIAKIKESVYGPDSGLYARLRELESWKQTSSRMLWIIITSVSTLTIATLYKLAFMN